MELGICSNIFILFPSLTRTHTHKLMKIDNNSNKNRLILYLIELPWMSHWWLMHTLFCILKNCKMNCLTFTFHRTQRILIMIFQQQSFHYLKVNMNVEAASILNSDDRWKYFIRDVWYRLKVFVFNAVTIRQTIDFFLFVSIYWMFCFRQYWSFEFHNK